METLGIGGLIRRRREALGLSQTRLAALVGMSRAYLSQIEHGKTTLPSADVRRRLAAHVGLRHIDLLIAAGEIAPDEVPGAGAAPAPEAAIAARLAALRPDDRASVDYVIGRLEQLREAELAASRPPDAAPPAMAPATER